MATSEPHDESVAIVRTALPQMSKRGIPVTPPNFAVWYEYFARANPALGTEIDELIESGQAITETETRKLDL